MSAGRWMPQKHLAAHVLGAAQWTPKQVASALGVSAETARAWMSRPAPADSRDEERLRAVARRLRRVGWTLTQIAEASQLTVTQVTRLAARPKRDKRTRSEVTDAGA